MNNLLQIEGDAIGLAMLGLGLQGAPAAKKSCALRDLSQALALNSKRCYV